MREIKFRAYNPSRNTIERNFDIDADGNVGRINMFETYESEPSWILIQFVGLKDKNGVDIYEGDIIPCKVGIQNYSNWVVGDENAELNGVVEWNPYQLCWHISFKQPNKYGIVSSQFGWGSTPILEVIGNIYENSELINPK